MFIFFLKSLLYKKFDCSFSFTQRVQAQSLSAIQSNINGQKNHKMSFVVLVVMSCDCAFIKFVCSIFPFKSLSFGKSWQLHLLIIVPFLSNNKPGLLRIIVFNVVASVLQKGYSAPVISRQKLMPFSPLAVRQ